MSGPLQHLLDSPVVGSYLRIRLALLFALLLTVVLGGAAISVGGPVGVALLLGVVACGLLALLVVAVVR
ncbi:hypothetical protein [Salinirubrum litoreum]|uniref:Sensor histidine kinase n=1 Tax=Salinirubrum litoreum TaxID=1126234 RepID=A0ABD5R871_9EURY|nr:hypothetical protein [Salinirubrum litoreum]